MVSFILCCMEQHNLKASDTFAYLQDVDSSWGKKVRKKNSAKANIFLPISVEQLEQCYLRTSRPPGQHGTFWPRWLGCSYCKQEDQAISFMRALLQGHEKRSAVGSATPDFFSADILHCFSLYSTVNSKPTGGKKKKSIAYPKKLKKARISKEMAAAAQRHPRGLAITSRGAPHCPPTPSPPSSAGGGLEPAVPSLGGRLPGCTEGGGPALRPPPRLQVGTAPRLGTLPSAAPFLGCCPSLVVPPPSAPLLFFFLRIKITVLPPFEVLRCVPLGLK